MRMTHETLPPLQPMQLSFGQQQLLVAMRVLFGLLALLAVWSFVSNLQG